jgi:hypothetical protein
MSDWIDDFFEEVDEPKVTYNMRSYLLGLLERCRYYDNVHEHYEAEILDSDLDMVRFSELKTKFQMNELNVTYDYAPSQRELSKWIKRICNLE